MRRLKTLLAVVALTTCLKTDAAHAPAIASTLAMDRPSATEPLVIVVNRTNPVDDLTLSELRTIFLGNRSHWADGRRITLVMREPGEPERGVILRDVCGMSEDQLKTHFLHGLYTGEILVSPKILATPSGMRKFIFNVPGAIGYLRISDLDTTVKVVRINELGPDDKGYKLRVQYPAAN